MPASSLPSRRLSVAPMLDWTDRHYRFMARQITRNAWLYSEMVNSGAVVYGDKDRFLSFNEGEQPVALQLVAQIRMTWQSLPKRLKRMAIMKST